MIFTMYTGLGDDARGNVLAQVLFVLSESVVKWGCLS